MTRTNLIVLTLVCGTHKSNEKGISVLFSKSRVRKSLVGGLNIKNIAYCSICDLLIIFVDL